MATLKERKARGMKLEAKALATASKIMKATGNPKSAKVASKASKKSSQLSKKK